MISRALDIGADAVQIPQIGTKEDAERAAKESNLLLWENGSVSFYKDC